MKLLGIVATCIFLLPTCLADEKTVEIGYVQLAKSLSGTVTDPSGLPVAGVQVIEVLPDWQKTLRSTITDARGYWSLVPIQNQTVYFIRLVKRSGFNEVRVRIRLDKRKGKALRIKLPLA